MDKNKFVLLRRYKIITKDERELEIPVTPETCYYFYQQEVQYLILAIRKMDIKVTDIKEIVPYFIPQETEEDVKIIIGM